uniref:cellulase family glycosylhydrolase n=1 Tax=Eubacterium cellulosolvens TaxID=29322 RepID=UPI000685AD73|nr:cellulase family glycosylhydrolase [[Eubacterium] cellulosolvens]
MKRTRKLLAILLALAVVLTTAQFGSSSAWAAAADKGAKAETGTEKETVQYKQEKNTRKIQPFTEYSSQEYVELMGRGWNLGNSFDAVDTTPGIEDTGERAWGNPEVTKDLINTVIKKGFKSIRMPLTLWKRYDENYTIDPNWLKRYREVVDWATSQGIYVMVNIHHDSWIWLKDWDGSTSSPEYKGFIKLWEQLADYFKDESELVSFETINEPQFNKVNEIEKLDKINRAAVDTIRKSGGNNDKRMIIIPTLNTEASQDNLNRLNWSFLSGYPNDPNLIVTIHYYSEWLFSSNLGRTMFDELLRPDDETEKTPREYAKAMFDRLKESLTDKGYGVIIGEYGLLGNDAGTDVLELGEELKYYEYINYLADQYKICIMVWDNGQFLHRTKYYWQLERLGEMLEKSMTERSSYASGLDMIYLKDDKSDDIEIPLTLNGNTFKGIKGLTEGKEYTYDKTSATITLKASYVNKAYDAMKKDEYGYAADLVFQFSAGCDWHQYLVKYGKPVYNPENEKVEGSVSGGITIPVNYNSARIEQVSIFQNGGLIGPNSSWWKYLECGNSYRPDYTNGTLLLKTQTFEGERPAKDGEIVLLIKYVDGQRDFISYTKKGDKLTFNGVKEMGEIEDPVFSSKVLIYLGETEMPDDYHVEDAQIYYNGWGTNTEKLLKDTTWAAPIEIVTDKVDKGVIGYFMDRYDKRVLNCFDLAIVERPVVSDVEVEAGETAASKITGVMEPEWNSPVTVTYDVKDDTIATVDDEGNVFGRKKGTTKLLVTVTQWGRTDTFEGTITVTGDKVITPTPGPTSTPTPKPTAKPKVKKAYKDLDLDGTITSGKILP